MNAVCGERVFYQHFMQWIKGGSCVCLLSVLVEIVLADCVGIPLCCCRFLLLLCPMPLTACRTIMAGYTRVFVCCSHIVNLMMVGFTKQLGDCEFGDGWVCKAIGRCSQ